MWSASLILAKVLAAMSGRPVALAMPCATSTRKPSGSAVEPEAQNALELGGYLGVGPIEIRLLSREQMQVPLTVRDASPGRAAEHGRPVVRREVASGALPIAEDESRSLSTSGLGGQCFLEPRVLVGEVVRDEFDRYSDPPCVRGGNQRVKVGNRAEYRVDIRRVRNVVPAVSTGRRVERAEPQGVDSELLQIVQPIPKPDQVAEAIAVPVGEALRVDLIEHRAPPPGLAVRQRRLRRRRTCGSHGNVIDVVRHALSPRKVVRSRSLDRPAIVNACNRANRTRLLPVTQPPSGVRRPNGRTGKELQPEASRLATGEGTGSRPGGCGLRAGDRTAFVREGGDVGRGCLSPQPKRVRLVPE